MEEPRQPISEFSRRALVVAVLAVFVVGVIWLLWSLSQVALVVFAGLLLAVLLEGVADLIARWTGLWPRASLALVVVILLGSIFAACWFIGPQAAEHMQNIIDEVSNGIANLRERLRGSWAKPLLDSISRMPGNISGHNIIWNVTGILSTTTELITMIIFGFFLGIYLAADPDIYLKSVMRLWPEQRRPRLLEVASLLGQALRWWFVGRIVTMIAMGSTTAIGLWLLGMPMALGLGVIAGLLQFVPYLGAIVAAVPALLIGFTVSSFMTLKVVGLYVLIHMVEGYCVTPLIQQRTVALPPAALFTMQILLGALFGILGVILATPMTIVLIVLVQTLYLQDILGESVKVLGKRGI